MTDLRRGLQSQFERSVEQFPVAVLEGGRAVGKSTLCRMTAAKRGWAPSIDLTIPEVMAQLRLDPLRFLRSLPRPVLIDEAQLEPQLPLWVKLIVDERNGAPGQFVLTGSARLGRDQLGGSDPLAGRSIRLRLWPLTTSELAGRPHNSSASLFDPAQFVAGTSVETFDRPNRFRGGLPGIPGVRSSASAESWGAALSSHVESTIPLGVTTTRIDHSRLLRVFRYLAANPGQLLNLSRAASELGMKADTLRSYIDTLENAFLLFRAEANRPAEHRVLTAHPRVFAADTGLAAWALGLGSRQPLPIENGSLLENLVAVDLSATGSWSPQQLVIRHWRDDRSKREVDLVVLHPDGRLVGVEVKAASSVGPGDAIGLSAFAMSVGDRFERGLIVYEGERIVDLSPRSMPNNSIMGVPLDVLLGSATVF